MTDIRFFLTVVVCVLVQPLYAQMTAAQIADEAGKRATADESVEYIKKSMASAASAADKRSLYAFLGSVQEQLGQFSDACDSYAAAAAIGAGDAEGMPPKSSEQLVLDAVRCALDTGDYQTADSYLNSDVRNSKDETVLAYVRLYTEWSDLCKATLPTDLNEPVVILNAYSDLPSMLMIKPPILLTLWYITGKEAYADTLKKEFPKSPETAVVSGSATLLPAPFWYFVPRLGVDRSGIGEQPVRSSETVKTADTGVHETESSKAEDSDKAVCLQLGLFREKTNAQRLVDQLTDKGFSASITTETRPSGTTYFIVIVNDRKDGSIGNQLRTAGFEFYPVF